MADLPPRPAPVAARPAASAVPTGFAAGLPFGRTLAAPTGADAMLAAVATDLHVHTGLDAGVRIYPLAV